MGPANAATLFRQRFPQAQAFRVHLFGSLAATGKGHFTDIAIERSFAPLGTSFVWQPEYVSTFHPNGLQGFKRLVVKEQDWVGIFQCSALETNGRSFGH
jgi:hypothetical protein